MDMPLGDYLRRLRQKRGLSMNRLAALAQISQSTISRWEAGKFAPSMDELEAVLQQLGASPDELRYALSLINAPRAVSRLRLLHTPSSSPLFSGDLLRAMRRRKGWTLEQTARASGIAADTLSRWERSERKPSDQQLHALCYALNASEEEMVALTIGGIHLTASFIDSPEPLNDMIEIQVAQFQRHPFEEQNRLFDLFSLALEANVLSNPGRNDFRQALAKVHAFRAQGLTHRGRIAEAERYAYRVLNEVEIEKADAWLLAWAIHTIAKGVAETGKNPKPLMGVQILQDWLPAVRQWNTAEEWFHWNVSEYMMEAGLMDEAVKVGQYVMNLHQQYGYMGTDDRLAYARLLTATGQPERALDYLPRRQHYLPLQQAYDAFAWAETLLALGQEEEARSRLAFAEQTMMEHRLTVLQPKIRRLVQKMKEGEGNEMKGAVHASGVPAIKIPLRAG